MNSTNVQTRKRTRKPSAHGRGAATRGAILAAAGELIGELGWGRVTTRAIAKRAGVPLGAVSYHFSDKDQLLRDSAAMAVSQLFAAPTELARSSSSLSELLAGTFAWYAAGGVSDPSVGVLMEVLREAVRDRWLRRRIAAELREYRTALAELAEKDQARGALALPVPSASIAMLIAALLDGLLLHLILDPELDTKQVRVMLEELLGSGRPQ